MGLDVYVGPLTRYYSGDWENVAERAQRTRSARPRSAAGRAGAGSQDRERARLAVKASGRSITAGASSPTPAS